MDDEATDNNVDDFSNQYRNGNLNQDQRDNVSKVDYKMVYSGLQSSKPSASNILTDRDDNDNQMVKSQFQKKTPDSTDGFTNRASDTNVKGKTGIIIKKKPMPNGDLSINLSPAVFNKKHPNNSAVGKQIVPSSTLEYEMRMKDRHQRLKEYMERKSLNQRKKIAMNRKKEADRQKNNNMLLWETKPIKISGQRKKYDSENDPAAQLMFDGKTAEQYYKERYFEEVLGINISSDLKSMPRRPVIVRPAYVMRSNKPPGRSGFGLSHSQPPTEPTRNVGIDEPTIVKYNINSIGQVDGEDRTMNKYRYFNQDKKEVKYITTRRPHGTLPLPESPLLAVGSSLRSSNRGTSNRLPAIGRPAK
jgi:hypothetical protein